MATVPTEVGATATCGTLGPSAPLRTIAGVAALRRPRVARALPSATQLIGRTCPLAVTASTAPPFSAAVAEAAIHKYPKVEERLARHPRWRVHFKPTSACWLKAVEGFFA